MPTRSALLCSLLLFAVACGGEDLPPDMTFRVTFDGAGCQAAGLTHLRITYESGGVGSQRVSCNTRGAISVTFRDVPVGSYRILFEGLDGDYAAYSDRFEIRHTRGGTHVYPVDLRRATELVTYFTFAGYGTDPGLTCDEAQVTKVTIHVGNLTFPNLPCSRNGHDAAALTAIDPGRYDVTVEAFDEAGRKLYESFFKNLEVLRGYNEYTLNLLPLEMGGLEFVWEFGNGLDCSQAGVATIEWQLVDAAGVEVYSDVQSCVTGSGPTGRVRFPHDAPQSQLEPGLYALTYIRGFGVTDQFPRYEATHQVLYAPAGRTQGFLVRLPAR